MDDHPAFEANDFVDIPESIEIIGHFVFVHTVGFPRF
jgi:hypothetical protein